MISGTPPRALALLALLLVLACPALPAQTVRGTLVEEGSGHPVPGTLVVLVDASGKQVGGALSGADGAFLLSAPGPGRFQLRAERIGVRGAASRSLELAAGQTVELRLAAPAAAAFALEGLVVRRERKRCRALPRAGEPAAAVWAEVRKALGVAAWTERQRAFSFRLVQHERELDPASLAVRREATRYLAGVAANPYQTRTPRELAERGYVEARGDTSVYFAPDAGVLLSDEFLDAHCFWLEAGGREEQGLVGLAFEPTRTARRTGIRGVLWVDRRSGELRHLDFRYPSLELGGPTEELGGRVEFEPLPGGAWVVRRWHIRMPRVAQHVTRFRGTTSFQNVVQSIREEGGEILEVRTPRGELVRAAGRARLAGVLHDGAGSGPLAGAAVRLAGTSWATRTDGEGSFRMDELPEGRYRVEVDHPRLDSLAVSLPAWEMELKRDAEARLELATPSRREILAALCPGGITPGWGVLLGTVRGTAGAVQGTVVTVDWSRWEVSDGEYRGMGWASSSPTVVQQHRKLATSTLDDRDRYRVCGVPADVPLHVYVESAGVRGRAQTIRVAPGEIRTLDVGTPTRGVAATPDAQSAGEPVAVEGVTVVAAPREPRLEAGGFYDRQKMGVGAFFTGSPTIAGRDLPGLIRGSGLQVRIGSRGFGVLAARAMGEDGPCALPVFIDGVLVPYSRTAALLNTPLAAVEVYRDHTELPPRFREQGACGAVVVWTAPRR
jgi:hypothetical protein